MEKIELPIIDFKERGIDIYPQGRQVRFKNTNDSKYADLSINYDKKSENFIAELYIDAPGEGLKFFKICHEYLLKLANKNRRTVRLFMEPSTTAGGRFIDKLSKEYGYETVSDSNKFRTEGSRFPTPVGGYSVIINPEP